MTVCLRITDLAVAYGHIEAVKGIALELQTGEITALVGANGAGKSTTLLALSGLLKPKREVTIALAGKFPLYPELLK